MKLLVRTLWFPHDVERSISALRRMPQVRELFEEGSFFDGDMKPRGLKAPHYIAWPRWYAGKILDRLPKQDKDVYLILTDRELMGEYGRISGKGNDRRAIASVDAYTYGNGTFDNFDVGFNAMALEEIGHALGLNHHRNNPSSPCVMFEDHLHGPEWPSLEKISFCNPCYAKIRRR